MREQWKGTCNCYEGIDRMINEGGRVDYYIWTEKRLKLQKTIPVITMRIAKRRRI